MAQSPDQYRYFDTNKQTSNNQTNTQTHKQMHTNTQIGHGGTFFLPQKPYCILGSLKNQITYPFNYQTNLRSQRESVVQLQSEETNQM
jgi:ABC-type uncharacterized transport system fused permease/ATPase subunit